MVFQVVLNMIYILQHVEALEILLQGLCGVLKERLRIHEICLKSGPNLGEFIYVYFFLIWSCVSRSSFDSSCDKLIRSTWNRSLTFCKPILKAMKYPSVVIWYNVDPYWSPIWFFHFVTLFLVHIYCSFSFHVMKFWYNFEGNEFLPWKLGVTHKLIFIVYYFLICFMSCLKCNKQGS